MAKVFISYSHKDEKWKEWLQSHLEVLVRQEKLAIWDDRSIGVGADWLSEIEQSMADAQIAIMLISRHFLASDFIHSKEVPALLQRRKHQGLHIVPLIISPCAWQVVDWLSAIQGYPKDNQPLIGRDEHVIDELLAGLVQTIHQRFLTEPSRSVEKDASIAESGLQIPPNTHQPGSTKVPISANLSADNGSIVVGQTTGTPIINIYNGSVPSGDLQKSTGQISDPDIAITAVDKMLFCHVPAGPFWMGKGATDKKKETMLSETPAGEYDLSYDYWLAQSPVLVEQFQQFVSDSQWKLEDKDSLSDKLNDPVVRVSWDEAMAFCHWLTQHWRAKDWLPQGWRVTLPNEPEWEKAARGGVQIPVEPVIETISSRLNSAKSLQMQDNPHPQRCYPWGNEIDNERLNYNGNIGQVSSPGQYRGGRSVYGCEDLSGNVWEWTRSQEANYPYSQSGTDQWRQREAERDNARRVLRGGAFDCNLRLVRAAVRYDYLPNPRNYDFGFRVCLSPFL